MTRTFHILYWINRLYDETYNEMTRTFHILYWIKRLYRNDENFSHFILNQKVIKKWRELFTFYIESKDYNRNDENISHFILNQKII